MGYLDLSATIAYLSESLGVEAYTALAGRATSMTNAAMAAYAFNQIDRARAAVLQ
ncbi:MAG: hypothetical protein QOE20_5144 [Mycobacterium sp.]|nr:hypothetical protein [Mycobacterium sp.]